MIRRPRSIQIESPSPGSAVAAPDAEVADDDVVGADDQGGVGERDAAARRALAGDGDARLADDEVRGEADRAGDIEDDGARPARLDRGAQAAGAAVGETGDAQHRAASAARRESSRALGAGKGEGLGGGGRRHPQAKKKEERRPRSLLLHGARCLEADARTDVELPAGVMDDRRAVAVAIDELIVEFVGQVDRLRGEREVVVDPEGGRGIDVERRILALDIVDDVLGRDALQIVAAIGSRAADAEAAIVIIKRRVPAARRQIDEIVGDQGGVGRRGHICDLGLRHR